MSTVESGITTISLSNCSRNLGEIESRLKALDGVRNVSVDFVANAIEVEYDPALLTNEKIRDSLKRLSLNVKD